jgi:2-polyprenyl-6-methoxyphenol hydroxylase-like FAD-dependent oxidoreductase
MTTSQAKSLRSLIEAERKNDFCAPVGGSRYVEVGAVYGIHPASIRVLEDMGIAETMADDLNRIWARLK